MKFSFFAGEFYILTFKYLLICLKKLGKEYVKRTLTASHTYPLGVDIYGLLGNNLKKNLFILLVSFFMKVTYKYFIV